MKDSLHPADFRVISVHATTLGSPRNPYRNILRRDYPEPFIALLAFVLGIWLWDHYFVASSSYAPGTEEIALIKIDRDLRLADAMQGDPAWLKWIAGADDPQDARANAVEALRKLAAGKAMTGRGLAVLTVLQAVRDEVPVAPRLVEILGTQATADFDDSSRSLKNHEGTWWDARWIESAEHERKPAERWRSAYDADLQQHRSRAVAARGFVWLTGFLGLLFLPMTVLRTVRAFRTRPRGYAAAWPVQLGLAVFLLATLAWIGFTTALEAGISALPDLSPLLGILLDSAARLLPTVIALAILFRRPSHIVRTLGLDRTFAPGLVFGWTALLMMIDLVLRQTIGADSANEPGGGLSLGDSGLWGLIFAVVSACLLAPVSEEILYRGILFQSFRNRIGLFAGAIVSSAVFTVLHFYDGYGLASVGIFGVACALLYAATGSLTAAIALHVLYNSLIKLPEWLVYHAPFG